ncbi:unnamed protein product [Cunninghamella blakesleeana]
MIYPILSSRDINQDDPGGCQLMDTFAVFIQLCLATIAFSTLLLKRHREKPQRPLPIYLMDISKQVIGSIFVHFKCDMCLYIWS